MVDRALRTLRDRRHLIFCAARVAAVVTALSITILSLLPPPSMLELTHRDKTYHVVAYAVLACATVVAWPRWRHALVALPAIVILGCVIEGAQWFFVVGRVGDSKDVIANIVGVAIGTVIGRSVVRLLMPTPPAGL